MPELPPGWWVKNNEGEYSGPRAAEEDHISDDDESDDNNEGNENLDIEPDSPGWEDIEPDTEDLSFQCLLCPQTFPSAPAMLHHCKSSHDFDFLAMVKDHQLDFYTTMKYINYIRLNATAESQHVVDIQDLTVLNSDDLLRPVLENDALLFTLGDLVPMGEDAEDDHVVNGTARDETSAMEAG